MASPLDSDKRFKSSDSKERLPFEPRRSQKKSKASASANPSAKTSRSGVDDGASLRASNEAKASGKRVDVKAAKVQAAKEKLRTVKTARQVQDSRRSKGSGIPEAVSQRMVKRMVLLAGTPMLLGVATFFTSYYIVSHDLFRLPTVAVLLVSLGFFGLSVLGLSYGALSASWEETDVPGSLLGWKEFRLNFGRMRGSWQDAKQSRNS
ncbi:MAG: PAM68 family protein [Elainellaceae cyanobacterium]